MAAASLREGRLRFEGEEGEGGQPVLAHVVAGDVREARREVRVRGGVGAGAARVVRGPGARERAPAPRAAQVEPVEVRDLAVRAVADGRGAEERRGLTVRDAREKGVHPRRELAG